MKVFDVTYILDVLTYQLGKVPHYVCEWVNGKVVINTLQMTHGLR